MSGQVISGNDLFIALLAKETGAATLIEVAEHFNRDIATISGAVSRIRKRSLIDGEFNSRNNILFAEFASIRNKHNRTKPAPVYYKREN